MTIKKAINSYLRHSNVYSTKGYHSFNLQQAAALLKHFDDNTDILKLTYDDIYKFIETQQNQGLKNNTINKRLSFLRRVGRFNDIKGDIANIRELRVQFITFGRVSDDDLLAADEAVKELPLLDQLIYNLFKDTGARASELINAKAYNVDLGNSSLTLDVTKTGKSRIVFYTPKTKRLLRHYISTARFNTKDKTELLLKVNREKVNWVFKKIKKRSGVIKISPHRLRHTLSSELYAKGCDLLYISRLMGHCNLETTKGYIEIKEAQELAIYNKYTGGLQDENNTTNGQR